MEALSAWAALGGKAAMRMLLQEAGPCFGLVDAAHLFGPKEALDMFFVEYSV